MTVAVRGRVAVLSWDCSLGMGCPFSNFAGLGRFIESRSGVLPFPFEVSISNLLALLNRQASNFFGGGG